jgi:hypothetical protein
MTLGAARGLQRQLLQPGRMSSLFSLARSLRAESCWKLTGGNWLHCIGPIEVTKMPEIDKHASRGWRSRLTEVLNRDWDPIGGCPEDESTAMWAR